MMIDPHIHMTSRTTDDYEAMQAAGIRAVVEPAFWAGQSRNHVGSFEDYFLMLLGWEKFRASQFGIRHFCTLGINPKEANRADLVDGVFALLRRYLSKAGVVAVGEIGYDEMTSAEEKIFGDQLLLAREFGLPALVHLPHRDKVRGTVRTIALVREVGIPDEQVLIDHNTEETLPLVLETGCWAGHSIYPNTKMDEKRMVDLVKRHGAERIMINSAADWGISDPLKVPKTAAAMRDAGIAPQQIHAIVWENPIAFFAQSGRIDAAMLEQPLQIDQREAWEGNSVLRGQAARIET
ncbi:MAG: TatD family hydrolase [Sulfuricellaceae bacterium]